jgi:hypothetical protein
MRAVQVFPDGTRLGRGARWPPTSLAPCLAWSFPPSYASGQDNGAASAGRRPVAVPPDMCLGVVVSGSQPGRHMRCSQRPIVALSGQ